jgi:hypothetical protein
MKAKHNTRRTPESLRKEPNQHKGTFQATKRSTILIEYKQIRFAKVIDEVHTNSYMKQWMILDVLTTEEGTGHQIPELLDSLMAMNMKQMNQGATGTESRSPSGRRLTAKRQTELSAKWTSADRLKPGQSKNVYDII